MKTPLNRLIAAAREAYAKAPPVIDAHASCEVPPGFGRRVVAGWRKSYPDTTVLLERWAWRGLAFSLAICALTAIAQETFASAKHYPDVEVMAEPGGDLF